MSSQFDVNAKISVETVLPALRVPIKKREYSSFSSNTSNATPRKRSERRGNPSAGGTMFGSSGRVPLIRTVTKTDLY